MRNARTLLFFAAFALLGAGCLPPGLGVSSEAVNKPSPVVPSGKVTFPPAESDTNATSGVRGQVLIAAICPAERAGDPACGEKPYAADLRIATKSGTPVKKFSTEGDGTFKVGLIPGTYVIGQPPNAPPMPRSQDQEFVVTADAWADVIIRFDAGNR